MELKVNYKAIEDKEMPRFSSVYVECEQWEGDGEFKAHRAIRKKEGMKAVIKILSVKDSHEAHAIR